MKRLLWTLFIFTLPFAHAQQYHPHRVLFQFVTGAPLLTEARSAAKNTSDNIISEKSVSPLKHLASFFATNGIESLQPVVLDDSSDPLAEGMQRIFVAVLSDAVSVEDAIQKFRSRPDIEYAEPDFVGSGGGEKLALVTPNDPYFVSQWALKNTGQTVGGVAGIAGADINMVPAWDITTGDSATLLAVLDSGIPASTAEFEGRLVPGYDFVNNDSIPNDDHGHGSNVTSVAAASGNNGVMMAGVNWKCRIMHLKILDATNSGLYSWWASALTYAANSGANVISMSVGGSSASATLQNAINYAAGKGCIMVACMMNFNNEVPYYPAAYSNVIAVGAVNNLDKRAVPFCWGGGSNYGNHIDVVAPGDYILGLVNTNPLQANYWCGTSQATPMVSGLISLMIGMKKDLTFQQVYDVLKSTAKDSINSAGEDTKGWDKYFGWGMIDAFSALTLVKTLYTKNAIFSASSKNINFGNVQTSFFKDSSITITNTGTDTLVIFSVVSSNPVFVSKNTSMSFPPGASRKDTIRFSPLKQGIDSATITFSINSASSPSTIKVYGTGTNPSTVHRLEMAVATFSLSQNYPNPFNPSTRFHFSVPQNSLVTLQVYDVLGKIVATLVNEQLSAGAYTAEWNAHNFPSGLYFYTLRAGTRSESKRMILLK